MLIYAGIGARKTPLTLAPTMRGIASKLEELGFLLHSGGAEGADTYFAEGVCDEAHKLVFYVDDVDNKALIFASRFHPNFDSCSEYVQQLHARNGYQVLGRSLDAPVEFVVCWTPGGRVVGGTGQALRIAVAYKIPIFNLFDRDALDRLEQHVKGLVGG